MSVGAKHLEDKLSVIAKNSSPNASPVQLSVVRCSLSGRREKKKIISPLLPLPSFLGDDFCYHSASRITTFDNNIFCF
ncbi:MAG: hypothetical protein HEP80_06925 [Dolichospermum sp. UKL201]|nr:MAG: hypothetical protein HEP80_06925 [Dolichospermum sp. UKL201]